MNDDQKRRKLREFLAAAENTITRERMYFNRLFFELKLAGARQNYALTVFEPEVDRDGFDVILDDHDNVKRLQLKTLVEEATTAGWKLHKRLLRPNFAVGEQAGWAPMSCGLGGGLLVIDISLEDPASPFTYRYTDWCVLSAIAEGLVVRSGNGGQKFRNDAYQLLSNLAQGRGSERIAVPQRFLLKPKTTDHLLALAGLHNCTNVYQPFGNFLKLFAQRARISDDGSELAGGDIQLAAALEHSAEQILTLVDEPSLVGFQIPEALKVTSVDGD